MLCGLTAGAWLGAAEAPTKLVTLGLSPVVISLSMVIGVFLARWTLPALIQGTSYVAADLRQAPHLIVWAVLAGCLWAVANTLTIFAVRDVGLSIAFPLWNSNSLVGGTTATRPPADMDMGSVWSSLKESNFAMPAPSALRNSADVGLLASVVPVIVKVLSWLPLFPLACCGGRCTSPTGRRT